MTNVGNLWRTWQKKFLALKRRERLAIGLAILMLGLALFDGYWLTPMLTRLKQSQAQSQMLSVQLQQAAMALTGMQQGESTRELELLLDSARSQLQSVKQHLLQTQAQQNDTQPLRHVLSYFLKKQEGLVLVRTATLAEESASAQPLPAVAPVSSAPAAAVSAPELPPQRQGLELTISGSYAALYRYVQSVEKALPNLHWGRMKLEAASGAGGAPVLTMQVYVLKARD